MSEKLCLQWNNFKDNVKTAFGNLREDFDFCDVTLACEDGQQVKAHKVILASSSPFFQNILKKKQHPHPLIYMRGLKPEVLVAIVDFLYCGEADVFQENLDSFLTIAEELQLKGLMGNNDEQSSNIAENEAVAPKETKSTHKSDPNMSKSIGPGKAVYSGQVATNVVEQKDRTIAVTNLFSAGEWEEHVLVEKIKSLMEKTQNRTQNGLGFMYICTVCGKEGQSINVQNHIESNHMEGLSIPCNLCDKTARSRNALFKHKRIYHKDNM